ncbi:MAG TPA: NAD(P)/FAD-dependent oxidoreductase [Roseiflexaceae bacterium]|nr:NAD(P)/FAD-dependent oxidoreductase [Roseiflexaceae bacterium]
MTQPYDAIIIGGGHNGLVAACYLAKAGRRVLVLERYHTVGGAAITEEIHPGFHVSVASYSMSLMRPEIIAELRLPEYGFAVYPKTPSYFMPFPDGEHILLYAGDRERTKREIARFSAHDAAAYDAWEDFWDRCCDIIEPTLMQPPISHAELAQRFGDAGYSDDWRRLMLLSMGDLLGEFFESEYIKAIMVPQSLISTMAGPATPGAPYVFLVHAIGRAIQGRRGIWGYVRGGMGTVTRTLAAAATDLGVEIRTSAPVAQVLVEHGAAAGVILENGTTIRSRTVLSNAEPKRTFLGLCPESALPEDFRTRLERNWRTGGTVYKLNLALAELPRYRAAPPDLPAEVVSAGTIDIAPTLGYLERAWDDFKRGEPSREPFIEIFSQSPTDPTLAPPGKHVMSCFCQYFPYEVAGRSWDDGLREEIADRILAKLAEYAPNITNAVIARQMLSPLDLERRFGLTGGNIFHGEITPDQSFNLRPVSGFADYRTPLAGLYLCGSGAHPGGGVTGIPGYNCAQVVIGDLARG